MNEQVSVYVVADLGRQREEDEGPERGRIMDAVVVVCAVLGELESGGLHEEILQPLGQDHFGVFEGRIHWGPACKLEVTVVYKKRNGSEGGGKRCITYAILQVWIIRCFLDRGYDIL